MHDDTTQDPPQVAQDTLLNVVSALTGVLCVLLIVMAMWQGGAVGLESPNSAHSLGLDQLTPLELEQRVVAAASGGPLGGHPPWGGESKPEAILRLVRLQEASLEEYHSTVDRYLYIIAALTSAAVVCTLVGLFKPKEGAG